MGKYNIMLVDDEQVSITPIKELLESLGYRVIAAVSGQEAIAIYMEKGKKPGFSLFPPQYKGFDSK